MIINLSQPAKLQAVFDKIEIWCKENKMKLNEKKCYLLPIKKENNNNLRLNGKQFESEIEQKDLGVVISTKFTWKSDCENRCTKAWKAFFS